MSTIPPGPPFLDTLARGIVATLDQAGVRAEDRAEDRAVPDPLAATRVTVLLPTRRACRGLREAFLRVQGGTAALLPRILPLGDLEEDEAAAMDMLGPSVGGLLDLPPALPGLTRQLLLTRLILARDGDMTPGQAARLALDLGHLLDQAQTERVGLETLSALVPEDSPLAEHWRQTLAFLGILTQVWPAILEDLGHLDPADHRDRVLAAQARAWRHHAPPGPVIAAGSTGSIPATADLLSVIASLPQGQVVLPGLDRTMDEASWDALEDTHPQAGIKRLLARLGVDRSEVVDFSDVARVASGPQTARVASGPQTARVASGPQTARALLVGEAMRPAATSHAWRDLAARRGTFTGALDGLTLIEAPGPRDEAAAIALILREVLETDGRTAALITPDRALARRVVAALGRWGLDVDDSAGRPLAQTPVGSFLRLAAEAVADQLGPISLLSLLQHPLAAGGEEPGAFRARLRLLDREVLRGPRPDPGFPGLRAALVERDMVERLGPWLDRLEILAAPFLAVMTGEARPFAEILEPHMRFCEGLATSEEFGQPVPGASRLWVGDAGEAAARLASDLTEAAGHLGPVEPRHYPALLDALMGGLPVRPRRDLHSRLSIWGPLEARLQRADITVLGGLNEGTWPAQMDTGPWMSRPMLQRFGLPQPERRVGLAAHDVAQALHAPEVVLTRSGKVDGTPTVPSRWITRLDAVVEAAGLKSDWEDAKARGAALLAWARALEQPEGSPRRSVRPHPTPPLADRPRRLSVTRVETWMRDPYALYAEFILGLKELDSLEADPGAADYGTLVHAALERFAKDYPRGLPGDPEEILDRIGREVFADHMARPGVRAFWWPRFQRVAKWFADQERARRDRVVEVHAELRGMLTLDGPGGPFTLTATADRIDVFTDGTLAVLDYKTGTPPARKEVDAGLAPQLPLEGGPASRGAFPRVPPPPVSGLGFLEVRGGRGGGGMRPASGGPP
ncbi:MAG: double-strand break repair protein AddB, partial [Rhodospirillum sp.]|nr:double-strand break repair protein AddB [Rhodospirillum sp.]